MTPDEQTVGFYDAAARDYAEKLVKGHVRPELARFIARLPAGARVLDLGCGPGNASAAMAAAGLRPDPVDASDGMVRFAAETYGVPARLGTFDEDFGRARYDGIWASYSLLHARRAELPGLVARLCAALRPGGTLYLGMKLGEGEARDALGRHYAYVSAQELRDWTEAAGLEVLESVEGESRGMAGTLDPTVDFMAARPADG